MLQVTCARVLVCYYFKSSAPLINSSWPELSKHNLFCGDTK